MKSALAHQVVLASHNAGKLRELTAMLAGTGLEVLPPAQFNISAPLETGSTFVENALIKARYAARVSALPAIADDSGICVDALDGAPGVYSADYAGSAAADGSNVEKLLRDLHGVPERQRSARFICVLVYLRHAADPLPLIAQGEWDGVISIAPQGANGFGYDPVFYVPTHACTSAQLPPAEKNRLSHRGQALRELARLIKLHYANPTA